MPDHVFSFLPGSLHRIAAGLPREILETLQEIRIRESRPLEIVYDHDHAFVDAGGKISDNPAAAYRPSHQECLQLLDLLTDHSLYTFEEELKRGFITVRGGHRVGLCGRVVLDKGEIKQIKDVTGFNIRLAREMIGAGRSVLPYLIDFEAQTVRHTLLISPPLWGKTTVIRDLARMISTGEWPHQLAWKGKKVGIIDERSELAACVKGVPTFHVGPRTDVMDHCPKAEGMMMMIRSMSPDVLVVDEIGRPEDAAAIREALRAGIKVLATAHGAGLEDIRSRPMLRELIEEGIFERYVVLPGRKGTGRPLQVFDGSGFLQVKTPFDSHVKKV